MQTRSESQEAKKKRNYLFRNKGEAKLDTLELPKTFRNWKNHNQAVTAIQVDNLRKTEDLTNDVKLQGD